MFDMDAVTYIDTICVKDGDISVKDINLKSGKFTLVIPVFNGEYNCKQIAELPYEFSYDAEDITSLYGKLPRNLLTPEDISLIYQKLWEFVSENDETVEVA